jgi:hypothetical protein
MISKFQKQGGRNVFVHIDRAANTPEKVLFFDFGVQKNQIFRSRGGVKPHSPLLPVATPLSIVDFCYMPTASAKYISPLDNPIWHTYKEIIRSQHPITTTNLPSLLSQIFLLLSKQQIKNAYRKCAIVRGANVFYDQPPM